MHIAWQKSQTIYFEGRVTSESLIIIICWDKLLSEHCLHPSVVPVPAMITSCTKLSANSLHKIILQYNFTIKVHSVQATSWGSYGTLIRLTINSTIYEQYCITYIIHYINRVCHIHIFIKGGVLVDNPPTKPLSIKFLDSKCYFYRVSPWIFHFLLACHRD